MSGIGGFFSALFWGLLLLSFLVLIHEGGHFLAARLFGVRVTEFFLGMPSRLKLSFKSKKYGTEFGVTPLLIGGYNRICGIDITDTAPADEVEAVLACVHRHGKVTVSEVASECGLNVDHAQDILILLSDWASVKPFYDPELGEKPDQRYYPHAWMTPQRDAHGLTVYDGKHDFSLPGGTQEGEAFIPKEGARAFYEAERSHTYAGLGFFKKAIILVAGITVNLCFGIALFTGILSTIGVETVSNNNVVGSIVAQSAADRAGLLPNDTILSIDGTEVSTWEEASQLFAKARENGNASLVITRNSETQELSLVMKEGEEYFGVNASTEMVALPLGTSFELSFGLAGRVLQAVCNLFIPTQTLQVLDQSSSVVGVSVIAAQAAEQDFSVYLYLVASVSLSLGFMNLIPIPLLDGGKLLLEMVQALSRRRMPAGFVKGWSYVGIALLACIFVYTLRADILRIISGGMVLG